MMEQYVLFCKKHRNYGTGNINVGTNLETDNDVKLALTGLWFRLNDKIQRLKQLVVLGEPDTVGESVRYISRFISLWYNSSNSFSKEIQINLAKPNTFRILRYEYNRKHPKTVVPEMDWDTQKKYQLHTTICLDGMSTQMERNVY
jgi:hypothetical protein